MVKRWLCLLLLAIVIVQILSVDPYHRGRGSRRRQDRRKNKRPTEPSFEGGATRKARRKEGRRQDPGRLVERPDSVSNPGDRGFYGRRGRGGRRFQEPAAAHQDVSGWEDAARSFFKGGLGHGGHRDKWWQRLFKPRRFHFGMGPDWDNERGWLDFDFRWGPYSHSEPWWQGPNVCYIRNEDPDDAPEQGEITSHMSIHTLVCDGSETSHKCVSKVLAPEGRQKVTELYECCAGFSRQRGDNGCPREMELENIPTTLEALELNELSSILETVGLLETLTDDDANLTLFAPTDDALQTYMGMLPSLGSDVALQDMNTVMVSKPISEAVVEDSRNLLLGHVAVGTLSSPHLHGDQLIETASPFKSKIRINVYQSPASLMTANCAPMTSVDNMATNGVVHVVDKVLPPVVDSLLQLVSKNSELSSLKTALGRSQLGSELKGDGHFTLFAPTDAAFKKLDPALLKKLLSESKCLDNILKNHLLPDVICSAIIQEQSRTANLLEKQMNLTRDGNDKLFVNGAQVVRADVMGTNGVLYLIDEVLIPDEALEILDLAGNEGASKFLDLVKTTAMFKELGQIENATVFVPTDEAIMSLGEDTLTALANDPHTLELFLRYHVAPSVVNSCDFYNGLQVATLNGDKKIRLNEYSMFPYSRNWVQTAQCAPIEKTDIQACNGVIHTITRVLVPPPGSIVDVLAQDPQFSILSELVKIAMLGDELQMDGPYTLFAPTDGAFRALGSDAVNDLKENPSELKKILLNHVARDMVCCSAITRSSWFNSQRIRMMSGEMYHLTRDRGGVINIDQSQVQKCDVTATNGVVHATDLVLMEEIEQDDQWPVWFK